MDLSPGGSDRGMKGAFGNGGAFLFDLNRGVDFIHFLLGIINQRDSIFEKKYFNALFKEWGWMARGEVGIV